VDQQQNLFGVRLDGEQDKKRIALDMAQVQTIADLAERPDRKGSEMVMDKHRNEDSGQDIVAGAEATRTLASVVETCHRSRFSKLLGIRSSDRQKRSCVGRFRSAMGSLKADSDQGLCREDGSIRVERNRLVRATSRSSRKGRMGRTENCRRLARLCVERCLVGVRENRTSCHKVAVACDLDAHMDASQELFDGDQEALEQI